MFRPNLPPVETPSGWWNSRIFLALLVLAAAIPLLRPDIAPVTDLMGHMGRYRVEISDPDSQLRNLYYDFRWALIANLGVDLLILPMAKIFGLELGVKLIVMAIPMLTVSGMLLIAREVHGRVPPVAFFALPLAYSYTFQWGFVNFLLSMALAFNAWALWLRLGRTGRLRLRAGLFVAIGIILYIAHVFGWAVLCLLAFASEVVRFRDRGRGFIASIWYGGWACLPLAPPLLLMALWRSGDAKGGNADWFYWRAKYVYMLSALRNHVRWFDIASISLLWALIALGLTRLGLLMNRTLGIAALLLGIAYLLLPRVLIGSAYADMRLAPYVVMVAVIGLSLRTPSRLVAQIVAVLGIAFFAARLTVSTIHYAEIDRLHTDQLRAIDHMKEGARVFAMVELRCLGLWDSSRMEHLGAMVIVRRRGFVNGQWTAAGAQLITIKYAPAKGYAEDPTQILRPGRCRQRGAKRYPEGLYTLPPGAFDYVWLIDMPRSKWRAFPGLTPIWNGGARGLLYRVDPPREKAPARPWSGPVAVNVERETG
ncbi:hypothetical protein [Sphingomonas oleivorans]|uniref:hypothetical protein n=1 Tax=Sphingomonas oleivorans TaxID=1735121 RepID=UPI001A9F3BD8|nr:hypothetical protein [Sphingomonas oleivorans]